MSLYLRLLARGRVSWRRLVLRPERGDVPGWVLITLMTAGLVAALWAVAQDQLTALFQEALASARR